MRIIASNPVSVSAVKEILEKRAGESELEYEQKEAFEHSKNTLKSDQKEAEKQIKELMTKNKKITAENAIKIIDIKPKRADTLKAILLKDKIELSEEELNEILKY